jgi:hypothetical protein
MTDRVKGFTVSLSRDTRIDDIADILTAISMIEGVCSVDPVTTDSNDSIIEHRCNMEFKQKLLALIREI